MYNYREAVKNDIIEAIRNDYDLTDYTDRESAFDALYDAMWIDDSITGNASGSYTFSTYTAEEYICHNLDFLAEAVAEFGGNMDILKDGAEACDVTIRCYMLSEWLSEALE